MIKVQKRLVVYCLSVSMFCILDITNVQGVTNEEIVTQIQWLQEQVQVLSGQLAKANTEIENLKAKRSEHSPEPGAEKLVVKDERGREVILPAYMTPPEDKEDTGFFLEAGLRYINPRGTDVDVGIVDPNTDNNPEGKAKGANYDMFPTGLYKVGYKFQDDSTISASFWNLSAFEGINLRAPTGGEVWTMFPATGNAILRATDKNLNGSLKLRLDQYDVDYTRPILRTQRFDLRGLVGARYADLDNDLTVKYINSTGGRETITSNTNTQMAGGKVGFLTEYRLFKGLSLFANSTLSMLVGNTDNTVFKVVEPSNPNIGRNVKARNESVYPILEEDIGLKYRVRRDLAVKAGYHFGYWGDVVTQQKSFGDNIFSFGYTLDHTQALTFDGATFSLEYTF